MSHKPQSIFEAAHKVLSGESQELQEAFSSRYFDAAIDLQSKLRRLFNPSGQLAKEIGRELEGDYSSEFRKLNDLLDQIDDVWGELEYEIGMSSAAEDEMMDDMDPSDFDESADLEEAAGAELTEDGKRMLLQRVNGIIDYVDSEMKANGETFNESFDSWMFGESENFIDEDLREIVGDSFEVEESTKLTEQSVTLSPQVQKMASDAFGQIIFAVEDIIEDEGIDPEEAIEQWIVATNAREDLGTGVYEAIVPVIRKHFGVTESSCGSRKKKD